MPKRKLNPLPSAAFQILLSLVDEDLHGYAIMRQVEEQTGGQTRFSRTCMAPASRFSKKTLLKKFICAKIQSSTMNGAATTV